MTPKMRAQQTLLTLAGIMFTLSTEAAVTKLPIPGGEVRDILYKDTNTAFAATQGGGIYHSSDAGISWSRLANSPAKYIKKLALGSGNTLYAATAQGVFSSNDDGASWTRLFNDASSAIAIKPGTNDSLLLGAPGAGIYRIDAGSTPSLSSTGLTNTGITSITYDPIDASIAYAGVSSPCQDTACNPLTGNGVYKSTDGGATWSDITGNLDIRFVTSVAVTNDRTLFASTRLPEGCGSGNVHRLPFGSSDWINPNQITDNETHGRLNGVETVVVDHMDGDSVWAGSCGIGLFHGVHTGGGNWSFSRQHGVGTYPKELLNAAYAIGSTPSSGRVTVAVRGAGLFTSANGRNGAATTWTEATGLHAVRATSFAASSIDPDTLHVGTTGAGVLRSLDAGSNWSRFNDGFPGLSGTSVPTLVNVRALATHPTNISKLAAITGAFGGYPGGIFQANSGNWSQPAGGNHFQNPIGLAYSATDDSIVLSNFDNQNQAGVFTGSATTGGFTQRLNTSGNGQLIPSRFVGNKIFLMTFGADDGAIGADGLGVVSSDAGSTWSIMSADHEGFMRLGSYSLAEANESSLAAATDKGLFTSSDGGANWQRLDINGSSTTIFSGLAYVGANLFAVSRSGGFFCSKDDGGNWSDLHSFLPETPVFVDLKVHDSLLYLVSDGAGIFSADPACP